MDGDQRLRRALAAFRGDVWAPRWPPRRRRRAPLRRRRVQPLRRPPAAGLEEEDGEAEAAAVSPEADAGCVDDDEESGLESKILAIRDFLEDHEQVSEERPSYHTSHRESAPNAHLSFFHTHPHVPAVLSQPEDELAGLLQNLADMDVTYNALQVQ
jgi:hypothetical protein